MSLLGQLSDMGIARRSDKTHAYVLMEGAAHPEVLARLEFHGARHRPLWRTDVQPELERHAPYLIEMEPQGEFDTWLASVKDDIGLTVILGTLALDPMASHLRRFSKFEDQGRRFFLRLGDPHSLNLYVRSIAADPESVGKLFANGRIDELYFHAPSVPLWQRIQPLFEQKAVPSHRLDGHLVRFDVAPKEAR